MVFTLLLTGYTDAPSTTASGSNALVGATPGVFAVNQGIAAYTIPIEVPPGTNGMQPDLAISYNSSTGNGMLGMGFSLQGLSTITRAPSTLEIDGTTRGVTYTDTDHFALDGKRLIKLVYNKQFQHKHINEYAYRTAHNSWINIIPQPTTSEGAPKYFIVKHPDGTVMEYGKTPDSRIEAVMASGSSPAPTRVWALNKVTDGNGNYMTITYTKDGNTGEYFPLSIDYTGNDKPSTVLKTQRQVRFTMEERSDRLMNYQAGAILKSTKRLKSIQTRLRGILVKEYNFTYRRSVSTNRSVLIKVKEGARAPSGKMVFLPPTQFAYPDHTQANLPSSTGEATSNWDTLEMPSQPWLTHTEQNSDNYAYTINDGATLADLNGDGLLDIAQYYNSLPWAAWINAGSYNSSGLFEPRWLSEPNLYVPPGPFYLGNRNNHPDSSRRYAAVDIGTRFLDLNGDGLPDMLNKSRSLGAPNYGPGWSALLNSGKGWRSAGTDYHPDKTVSLTTARQIQSNAPAYNINDGARLVDLNADGLQDLMVYQSYITTDGTKRSRREAYLNTGAGWQGPAYPDLTISHDLSTVFLDEDGVSLYSVEGGGRLADVNGDGFPDYVSAAKISHDNNIPIEYYSLPNETKLNNPSASSYEANWISPASPGYAVPGDLWLAHLHKGANGWYNVDDGAILVDLNGDNLPDLVHSHKDETDPANLQYTSTVYLNTGSGWLAANGYAIPIQAPLKRTRRGGADQNIYSNGNTGKLVDVNGDGLPDLIGPNTQTVWLNTGTGWVEQSSGGYSLPGSCRLRDSYTNADGQQKFVELIRFADLNADGLSDMIFDPYVGTSSVWLNNGSGWTKSEQYAPPANTWLSGGLNVRPGLPEGINTTDDGARIVDLNGDGLPDLLHMHNANTLTPPVNNFEAGKGERIRRAWLNGGMANPDRIIAITNGVGKQTEITYAPVSDKSVFSPKPGAAGGGLQRLQGALWVVKTTTEKEPGSYIQKQHRYHYQGLLSKDPAFSERLQNQGIRGFQKIIRTDNSTGVQRITHYHKDFTQPKQVGYVDSVLVKTKGGIPLSKTAYQYATTYLHANSRKIYQVLKTQEKSSRFSTSGHITDVKETNFLYDSYGNIKQREVLSFNGVTLDEKNSTTTYLSYVNDKSAWRIGLPKTSLTVKLNTPNLPLQQFLESSQFISSIWSWEKFEYTPDWNIKSRKKLFDWDEENVFRILTTGYDYTDYGSLKKVTDPMGNITYISYEKELQTFETSRVTGVNSSDGQPTGVNLTTQTSYDERFGVLQSKTDANGNQLSYDIDVLGRVTAMYGPHPENDSRVMLAKYGFGESEFPASEDLLGNLTSFTTIQATRWDTDISSIDPGNNSQLAREGVFWTKEYRDAFGRTIFEEAKATSAESNGSAAAQMRRNKFKKYNPKSGLLSEESLPYYATTATQQPTDDIQSVSFSYDSEGLIDEINAEGLKTKMAFSEDRRSITKTLSPTTQTSGAIESPRITTLLLDIDGKVSRRSDPQVNSVAAITQYAYDAMARPNQFTDPNKISNTVSYTIMGQKKSINNPDTGPREFEYNNQGLLEKEIDAKKNYIEYEYDNLARITQKTVYSSTGKEYTISYVYDGKDDAAAKAMGLIYSIEKRFEQDTLSKYNTKTVYQYDSYGRIKEKTLTFEGKSYTTGYAYNPLGKVTLKTYPDQSELQTTYYDDGNVYQLKLKDAALADPEFITYATFSDYTALGQPQIITYKNTLQGSYSYDAANGLLSEHKLDRTIVESPGNAPPALIHKKYGWNPFLELSSIIDLTDVTKNQTFGYSGVGRLISATGPYGQNRAQTTIGYQYDPGGNISSMNQVAFINNRGRGLASSNRLIRTDGSVKNLEYDSNGNTVTKNDAGGKWTYSYDAENRLTAVKKNDLLVRSFVYDHQGQLIKDFTVNGGGKVYISGSYLLNADRSKHTKFINGPDGNHLVSITHALPEETPEDPEQMGQLLKGVFPSGLLIALHAWGEHVFSPAVFSGILLSCIVLMFLFACYFAAIRLSKTYGRNRLVYSTTKPWVSITTPPVLAAILFLTLLSGYQPAMASTEDTTKSTELYYHHDHINSVNLITDSKGNEVHRSHFTPYGKEVPGSATSQSTDFPSVFAGKELVDDSKIYYYGARFYDPEIGRFLTPDTEAGANPLLPNALNRYAYAGGNPIIYEDPSGHLFVALLLGFVIGAVVGAATDAIVQATEIATGKREHFDGWQIFRSFAIGGMTGLIGAGVGAGVGAAVTKLGLWALNKVGTTLSTVGVRAFGTVTGFISGASGSFAGTTTSNLMDMLQGKDVDWANLGLSMAIGGGFGAVGGGLIGATRIQSGRFAIMPKGKLSAWQRGLSINKAQKLGYTVISKSSSRHMGRYLNAFTRRAGQTRTTGIRGDILDKTLTWINVAQDLTRSVVAAEMEIANHVHSGGVNGSADVLAQAFSTSGINGTDRLNYNGKLMFRFEGGQIATANDFMNWTESRNSLIKRWVQSGKSESN